MERLTERDHLGNAVCKKSISATCNAKCSECDYDYDCFKKLADYEDLEEQGLLHIAPLKDGTEIFFIMEDYVDFGETERYVAQTSYLHGVTEYDFGELNKDYWLTYEEAEILLKNRNKEKH